MSEEKINLSLFQDVTEREGLRTYPIAALICGSNDVRYSGTELIMTTFSFWVSVVCKFPKPFQIWATNPMECALAMC